MALSRKDITTNLEFKLSVAKKIDNKERAIVLSRLRSHEISQMRRSKPEIFGHIYANPASGQDSGIFHSGCRQRSTVIRPLMRLKGPLEHGR